MSSYAYASASWRTLGTKFTYHELVVGSEETPAATVLPCVEIINHLLKVPAPGQFKVKCLLEPGVVPLLTFLSMDNSRQKAKTEAAAALRSLVAWVKTDT
jgi:hypothetical protein